MLGIKGIPAKGGTERVVEALAVRMRGHDVIPTVYCGRYYTPAVARVPGVKLIRLPSLPGKHARATSLNVLAALHAVVLGRYDLIHVHNSEASFVLPLLRLRYRVISTRHGSAYWRAKWGPLARWLLRATDVPFVLFSNALTSVSAQEAGAILQRFGREVAYIPNGVGSEYEPDHPAARAVLDSQGIATDDYLLFVAGRIEPTKGAHLAIAALNGLDATCPQLLIIGDDCHHPEYAARLRSMAGPRVRFQQFIDEPGCLFGLIAGARCLIFPSTVEAMAMVLLEAASLGTPILCSDIPENREVLGVHATYFASGDEAALRGQLRWVLDNADLVRTASASAQSHVRSRFSWDQIAGRYVALYRSVQARRPGRWSAHRCGS